MPPDSENGRDHLLSPEEVARACGLSRRAVYRAISRGDLRASRLCNRLRVSPSELDRWIGDQTVPVARPLRLSESRPGPELPAGSLRALLDETAEERRRPS